MRVNEVFLEDEHAVSDLVQLMQRLDRVGGSEVRLRAENGSLALFGSTQAPAHLGDATQLVLVHRAVGLGAPLAEAVDTVVETRAVLDRLARIDEAPWALPIPPVNLAVAWAGMLPPRSGWQQEATLEAGPLHDIAIQGADRVAQMLPENPGQLLVDKARAAVWSLEIAPGIPAAAALALDSMGFLRDQKLVLVSRSRTWLRLTTEYGDVFVRDQIGML